MAPVSRAFPRVVIDHARYWRGAPHRWSTVYNISGSTPDSGDAFNLQADLVNMEAKVLYPGQARSGGFIEARVYGTGTGVPIYTQNYGTLTDPTTWVAYTGSAWTDTASENQGGTAETCLLVTIPLTGLSSRGKPVTARKYYHSVPTSNADGTSAADVDATDITSLEAALAILNNGSLPGARRYISESGRLPTTNPTVQPYYSNHQMPRGRKRKTSSGSSSLLSGIVDSAAEAAAKAALVAAIA